MRLATLSLFALGASVVSARFVENHEIDQVAINGHLDAEELYTIELAPGLVKKVTEDEKWELRRVCFTPSQLIKHSPSCHRYGFISAFRTNNM